MSSGMANWSWRAWVVAGVVAVLFFVIVPVFAPTTLKYGQQVDAEKRRDVFRGFRYGD